MLRTNRCQVTYDTTYDEDSTPLSQLACNKEGSGIMPDYLEGDTIGRTPPRIMGIDKIDGSESTLCGSCWMLVFEDEARAFLAVDSAPKPGIIISLEGMNALTGGRAKELGKIEVDATQVDLLNCGLYNPPNPELK